MATATPPIEARAALHKGADLEAIISLRGVTKRFGSHTVLEDISFDLPKGKISAIMGPSGTGKSVLLKNIIGLLRPDAGEIWVDGEETVPHGREGPLPGPPQVRRPLPGRRPVRLA